MDEYEWRLTHSDAQVDQVALAFIVEGLQQNKILWDKWDKN